MYNHVNYPAIIFTSAVIFLSACSGADEGLCDTCDEVEEWGLPLSDRFELD